MPTRWVLFLMLPAVAFIIACGGGNDATANLLANPGFENGTEPWHTMEGGGWNPDFTVSDSIFHDGNHSLHLQLTPPGQPSLNGIFGVVQDITVSELPEYVSGFYRVDNWIKGTEFQYLQFVVITFTDDPIAEFGNIQIRYLLSGAASGPFDIDNAKFIVIDPSEPVRGEWVHFARNIREDFQREWGVAPQAITSIRIFFEARFDSPIEIQPQIGGDVYFDDLYMGPQSKAPDN